MAASEGRGSLKTKHAAICDGKEEMPRAWVNTVLRVMGQWITEVFVRRGCVPWCWYFPPYIYVSRCQNSRLVMLLSGVRNISIYGGSIKLCSFHALWILRGCSAPPSPVFCCNCHGNSLRGVTEACSCTLSYRKIILVTYTLMCRGVQGVIHS